MLQACTTGSALCRTWQPHGAAGDASVHMGSLGMQALQQEHEGQKENTRPQLAALHEGPRGGSLEGHQELSSWPQLPELDPDGGSAGAQEVVPRVEGTQGRRPGALSLELAGEEVWQCCMLGSWLACGKLRAEGVSPGAQEPHTKHRSHPRAPHPSPEPQLAGGCVLWLSHMGTPLQGPELELRGALHANRGSRLPGMHWQSGLATCLEGSSRHGLSCCRWLCSADFS